MAEYPGLLITCSRFSRTGVVYANLRKDATRFALCVSASRDSSASGRCNSVSGVGSMSGFGIYRISALDAK